MEQVKHSTWCMMNVVHRYLNMSKTRGHRQASQDPMSFTTVAPELTSVSPHNQPYERALITKEQRRENKQLSLCMFWLRMWVPDKNRLQLQSSFTQGWPQYRVVKENLLNGQSFEQYNGSYVLCGKRNSLGWDYMEIHEQWPMNHLDWSSGQGPE